MRRVIVSADHVAAVQQVDVPNPMAGEALVQMSAAGVCGSDTHALHGQHPFIQLPYAPGHEVIGTVRAIAEGVTEVAIRERVVVEPTLPCWSCKQCRAGRENLCENLMFFGCAYPQGGMADFFTIPANRLHVIPDGLDDRQAILIEPLSTPVHAVRLAGPLYGKSVAILGAGTIGLLVLVSAMHHGAARVVVTDMLESKRQRALDLGAHAVVNADREDVVSAVRDALGESADVVFDCVAIQKTVNQAVAMALKAGTVVIVGVPTADVSVPLPMIQDQQVRIQGSATYLPEDFQEAIALILADKVRPRDFITASYALDDVAEAFAASVSGEHIKVIVTAS
ncbi:MAG: alcohol dehydrogenase catalytic domain-containing protein [Ilumatobacteraceae bacterium]|nr:alcohol dehydrogenase catalytic domain-containing protein [Ilumatobacteraceae bacterium]